HVVLLNATGSTAFHTEHTILQLTLNDLRAHHGNVLTSQLIGHVELGIERVLIALKDALGPGQESVFSQVATFINAHSCVVASAIQHLQQLLPFLYRKRQGSTMVVGLHISQGNKAVTEAPGTLMGQ